MGCCCDVPHLRRIPLAFFLSNLNHVTMHRQRAVRWRWCRKHRWKGREKKDSHARPRRPAREGVMNWACFGALAFFARVLV
jgi:hypothetical protein